MFFVLSKILVYFTLPFTWILGVLIFAFFTKSRGRRKRALIIAGSLFLFFSNSIIFDEFMRAWEVEGVSYDSVDNYDVAIVLGGMASYNNDLDRLSFGQGSDRILQALKLYRMGKVKKILICGDSGLLRDDGLDEARQLKEYLVSLDFPAQDILVETTSKNTHENAQNAKTILDEHPEYDRFLLVTSAYHMRRSLACFKKVGLQCDPFSTDHFTGKRWFSFERLFVPSLTVVSAWSIITHEVFGYVTYWMAGYI